MRFEPLSLEEGKPLLDFVVYGRSNVRHGADQLRLRASSTLEVDNSNIFNDASQKIQRIATSQHGIRSNASSKFDKSNIIANKTQASFNPYVPVNSSVKLGSNSSEGIGAFTV